MPGSVRLGQIGGIPIALHFSWFLIAALITLSLWNHFGATQPGWASSTRWVVALVTALLFFVTLLAHEFAHAAVARARRLPVHSITLFALGGVARIEKDASSASTELMVAIVGPLTSFLIGAVCLGWAQTLGWSPSDGSGHIGGAVLGWLGSINILLAAFNLIPAYPLDGGRVLRGILWTIYGNATRATYHAVRVGQAAAVAFIAFGAFSFFSGAGVSGLWLVFVGWFLLAAAQNEYTRVSIQEQLHDVRVADVMTHDCATVDPDSDVRSLVDLSLRSGRRCVVVERDGQLLGLVTPHDVRGISRDQWALLAVREVMRPVDGLRTVTPETPVSDAVSVMAQRDVNQLPVVSDGRLQGVVTRGHVLQLLEAHAALAR